MIFVVIGQQSITSERGCHTVGDLLLESLTTASRLSARHHGVAESAENSEYSATSLSACDEW
nr:hypothetical protein [Halomonas socia]